MANTYISSAKVRLYDQRSASILMHPETELSAVFCESGGILTISGNSIYVASSAIGPVVSSSGFIKEPLLEYTSGGSVTNVGSSAGYGTLLKTIDTIDHVRDTESATNGYLPTELAVAAALATKQNTLAAGTLIELSAPQADTGIVTISVPSTTDVMGSTVGLDTKVPTGMAVRMAVIGAKEEAISEALTSVGQAGYATQSWTQENFVSKGGLGYWTYATYSSAGVVQPISGSGIEIVSAGEIKLSPATTEAIGGVIVKASGGLVVNGGLLSVASAPVFTTLESALQSTTYGGVQVITALKQPIPDTENKPIIPNYNVVWNAVYAYSGDFTCTYHAGTNQYITAGSGHIYINGTTVSYSVTPTGQVAVSGDSTTDIWLNITYNASNQNPFSATIASTRATTTGTQSVLLARYDTTGVPSRYHKGPVIWDTNEGGGGTEYFGDFKVSCAGTGSTVAVTGGSYYLDGNTTAHQINSVDCSVTGATTGKTLWLNITSGSTVAIAGTTPSMDNTVYSVPLAYVLGSTVCQYQLGPVIIRGRWA